MLDRSVNELFHLSKRYNFIKLPLDLCFSHAEYGAVKEDILSAGKLWMKSCAYFEERANSSIDLGSAFCRLCNLGEDLQQRAFPGTVTSNDADDIALLDVERNV